jgi:hypothetical protein
MDAYEQISLYMPEEVVRVIEARRIMKEDLQRTIHHAETTGERFVNPGAGRFLAAYRPGRVTYWVEYSRMNDGYEIHTAYSHRMEMKRKGL